MTLAPPNPAPSAGSPQLALGVLGGMGPAATLDFLGKLQAFTPARAEADHIRVLVDINPKVPDLGTAAAADLLAEMAGALAGAGADVLAIACNTAHAHADLIQRASGLPLIDMIEVTASAARDLGARRVGVLGTRGALRLYREYLAAQGLATLTLEPAAQEAFVTTLDQIKAGDLGPRVRREMAAYAAELVGQGAQAVIAGCTEIPLVIGQGDVPARLIDPAEQLAHRCVAVCLNLEPIPALPA